MGVFTCMLILIVLYCPWLIPVLFVVFILFMIYHYSPVLFGILTLTTSISRIACSTEIHC